VFRPKLISDYFVPGIENSLDIILNVFKGTQSLEQFRESILRLKEDVARLMNVPSYQKSEVKAQIRKIIDKELPRKTTGILKNFL